MLRTSMTSARLAHPTAPANAKVATNASGAFLLNELFTADNEVGSPVPLPAALRGFVTQGQLLAVADRRHPLIRHSERDEVLFGDARALGTEGKVVLDRSAVVTVSLDLHRRSRVRLQPGCVLTQR